MTWPSIDPGILRHRVQIQVQTVEKDSVGQRKDVWTTILTTHAEIRLASGREVYQTGQFTSQVSHAITIRWSKPAIVAGMRALFTDNALASPPTYHYYRIQWIDNIEQRNVLLKLYCLEFNATE